MILGYFIYLMLLLLWISHNHLGTVFYLKKNTKNHYSQLFINKEDKLW
jgi:hypothetical protein